MNGGRILLVTAHLKEARGLAMHLTRCTAGPLPYRYTWSEGAVLVGGMGCDRMRSSLKALPGPAFRAALLFGVAGSLTDLYQTGMILQCPWVRDTRGHTYGASLDLGLPRASLMTVKEAVTGPAERERLYRETGVMLVDMEAHAFAGVMEERSIPWAVVRMVSDTPEEPNTFPFPRELDTLLKDAAACAVKALKEVLCEH